jgi:KTSC domain-containing protein
MEVVTQNKITIVSFSEEDSSFVTMASYDEETRILSVELKGIGGKYFENVPNTIFIDFITSPSKGNYYNTQIKQKFKFMSEGKNQPNKINRSDPQNFRWVNMSVNLSKIDKSWLRKGKDTGDYWVDLSMRVQPEGQVDQYGKLGMIVQQVPAELYKKDKNLKGAILGSAEQLDWTGGHQDEETDLVGNSTDWKDDLPF